jgi:hypothetical protein
MKRTGFDHPKHGRLMRLLNINHAYSVGIVESIWQFTAKHALRGDIGKWSDEEIAEAIDFDEKPAAELIEALVKAKWLDRQDDCRLIVHDWDAHCEDSVHLALARKLEHFANGNRPKLTRLKTTERPEIEAAYELKEKSLAAAHAQQTHDVHTECDSEPSKAHCLSLSLSLSQKPEPKPRPSEACAPDARPGKPASGVFEKITPEVLRNGPALSRWHAFAASRRRPVIGSSEQDRLRVFSAAERALEQGDNPAGLFAHIVGKRQWELITQAQEDRAAARLKQLGQHNRGAPSQLAADLATNFAPSTD